MRKIGRYLKRLFFIFLMLFIGYYIFKKGLAFRQYSSNRRDQAGLYSQEAILMDLEDGRLLYEEGLARKVYPASLTKIMTTIVALEEMGSLDLTTDIVEEDFRQVYQEGLAVAGFQPGDRVSYRDLMYGIILASGADAVNATTRVLGGEEAFVALMNTRARELGMKKTNFTNPTGLHDPNHYTTVEDLSKLLTYALENGHFRAIFTKKNYTAEHTGRNISSKVFTLLEPESLWRGRILGGKTGYTEKAGLCLASLYEEEGREYILITVGAEGSPASLQYNFLDAYDLYNGLVDM